MSITAIVPALVCLIGLLLWLLPVPPKLQEIGKICFAFGLLVTLFAVAHHVVKL